MTDLELLEQQEKKIRETSVYIETLAGKALNPYITYILIAINVIVFLIMVSKDAGIMETSPSVAFAWGANFPPETIENQWWRLITAAFIHYGIIHLLVNMTALYQSGEFVERVYGRVELLTIYAFSAIFGGFGTLLFNTGVVSAGASGAIFGLIGAELTYFIVMHKEIPSELYGKYFLNLSIFVGYNLFYGLTNTNIDNWAHLGGALGGMLIASPIMVRSIFKAITQKRRAINIALSIVCSIIMAAVLVNPAIHASIPYTNVKNYRKELASFSKVETDLDSQYKTFSEAVDKNPTPASYSDFNNFLEKQMIPDLEKGKENLLKYDTSSNSSVLNIQKQTDLYLDLRIKVLSQLLPIMKDVAKNKAPKKDDSDHLDELSKQFENQSKKVTELFKQEKN